MKLQSCNGTEENALEGLCMKLSDKHASKHGQVLPWSFPLVPVLTCFQMLLKEWASVAFLNMVFP